MVMRLYVAPQASTVWTRGNLPHFYIRVFLSLLDGGGYKSDPVVAAPHSTHLFLHYTHTVIIELSH
jgi:hypothetical protein